MAALLVVYALTPLAVTVYFRRTRQERGMWQTLVAPALAVVVLLGLLALVVANFSQLTGGGEQTVAIILAILPFCFFTGIGFEMYQARRAPSVRARS